MDLILRMKLTACVVVCIIYLCIGGDYAEAKAQSNKCTIVPAGTTTCTGIRGPGCKNATSLAVSIVNEYLFY